MTCERADADSAASIFDQWTQSGSVTGVFSAGDHLRMLGDDFARHAQSDLYSYVAAGGIQPYLNRPGALATSV
jgi:hypothetical protein